MTTTRKAIGSRRIPIHDHYDLNSGGKLTVGGAIVGGLDVITGSIPPSSGGSAASGPETVVDLESMGTAATINVAASTWYRGTLTANCAITVAGFAADAGVVAIFEAAQGGSGGWDITWDSDVEFTGESQPIQTASTVTVFALFSSAGDATIYGARVGGVQALTDLTDVEITSPAEDDDLRYNGSLWVNDARKWEAVTNGEDIFVWEDDDLVYEWSA